MTWQDELQNLDAELAAGRISAEEYRQRRDAVLGRAQNGPSSGGFPQQQPPSGPPSGGFPQQPNPFPPAFSWDAAAQGTQQGGTQQAAASDEATQVVPNPVAQPQAQQGDAESTQVVSLNHPPQWGPPQPQWGPQQGWGPVESVGTPWGDDLPGTPEHGDASWMRQGPEVFETAGKSGKGKLIAGLSIGGVLLVGLIVAGIFYFTSGGTTPAEPTAAPPPPVQTRELPAPPPANPNPPASPQEVLITPAGPANPWSGALDLPSLQGAKGGLLQPKTVLDTAIQSGLTGGWFNGSEGTPKTTLLALQLPNADAAKDVVDQYLGAQQGLSTMDDLSYQGVKVVNTGGTFRTAYVAHNWAIIIDVSAASSDQKPTAQESFRSVLEQQLNRTPPTVRD